jgi:hypothetical protein
MQPPTQTTISSAIDDNGNSIQNGDITVSTSIAFQTTAKEGSNPIVGFECSLDNSPFSTCGSTNPGAVSLTKLAAGQHMFAISAIDSTGNKDPMPATFRWFVLTPAQGIQQLLSLSQGMNLNPAIQAMITGLLNSAASILSDNNPSNDRAACNLLNTIITQLNVRAQHNQITPSQVTQLIRSSPYSIQAIEKAQGCM